MEHALRHVSKSNVCRGLDDSSCVDGEMLGEILSRKGRTSASEEDDMHDGDSARPSLRRAYHEAREARIIAFLMTRLRSSLHRVTGTISPTRT